MKSMEFIKDKYLVPERTVDRGFEAKYKNLSRRRKFIRDLLCMPLALMLYLNVSSRNKTMASMVFVICAVGTLYSGFRYMRELMDKQKQS